MRRNGAGSYILAGILILSLWTLFPVESVGQKQAASPVGNWEIRTPQASFTLVLKPDGSGTLNEEAIRWTFNAGILTLKGSSGTVYMYNAAITPASLTLSGGNLKGPLAFQRVGTGAAPGALDGLAAISGPAGGSAGSSSVVGTWQVPTREGPFTLVLRPDGSGRLPAGEMRWEFDQGVLRITGPGGTLTFNASVTPTSLTLSGGNFKQPVTFQRAEASDSSASTLPSIGTAAVPSGATSSSPVGTWETQGRSGPVIMDLRPDGSGTMAGESVRWQFNQGILSITRAGGTTHMYNATITPTSITLNSAGLKQPSVFRRVGSGAGQGLFDTSTPTGAVPAAAPAGGRGPPARWEAGKPRGARGLSA